VAKVIFGRDDLQDIWVDCHDTVFVVTMAEIAKRYEMFKLMSQFEVPPE
jgi:hypothetical protein